MKVLELGRMPYLQAWEAQKVVANEVIEGGEDTLIFVEHDPVLTLGANFLESNLLLSVEEYDNRAPRINAPDPTGELGCPIFATNVARPAAAAPKIGYRNIPCLA